MLPMSHVTFILIHLQNEYYAKILVLDALKNCCCCWSVVFLVNVSVTIIMKITKKGTIEHVATTCSLVEIIN